MTEEGRNVGVLVHHDGRRDILIYGIDDPDTCTTTLALSANDSRTMDELLGGSRITEVNNVVQHEIEGLSIEWITVASESPSAGHSIGEGAYRTRTGASIVAVIRAERPVPAPGPEFQFNADDVVVAVGTAEGLAALRVLLTEADTKPSAVTPPR